MARFISQKLAEQYEKLPEDLKQAVYSEDIALKLFDLGRKYGITIEKNGFLAEEVGYVILGLEKTEEFPKYVKERLDFDDEETAEIVKEINQQIFLPIREALKKAHQIEIKDLEEKTPEPRPPATPATLVPKTEIPPIPVQPNPVASVSVKPAMSEPEIPAIKNEVSEIQAGHFLDKKELEDLKTKIKNEVKPVTEQKPIQPIPPPAKPKLPPIDLRQDARPRTALPQFMSGAIFVPPVKKEEVKADGSPPLTTSDKPAQRTYDPYKEPVE